MRQIGSDLEVAIECLCNFESFPLSLKSDGGEKGGWSISSLRGLRRSGRRVWVGSWARQILSSYLLPSETKVTLGSQGELVCCEVARSPSLNADAAIFYSAAVRGYVTLECVQFNLHIPHVHVAEVATNDQFCWVTDEGEERMLWIWRKTHSISFLQFYAVRRDMPAEKLEKLFE